LRYPTGVVCGEDMVFVSLLRNRGPIVVLPELLYGYRRRSGQITKWYTFVDGFEQKMDWLRTNWKAHWPDKTLSEIETVMWLGLVEVMTDFYWSRDRKKFLRLRAYLRANWPGKVPAPSELAWRWYPDALWRAKEWLTAVLHQLCVRP
jgi:hypothetical protein